MITIMHQYTNYIIAILVGIWTVNISIASRLFYESNSTIFSLSNSFLIIFTINLSVILLILWRYYIHYIDNDIVKNYSRLVFFENALANFKSTPNEQTIFYNLTKDFPGWIEWIKLKNPDWNEQYEAFCNLIKMKKMGPRGQEIFDKIAVYLIISLLFFEVVIYLQLLSNSLTIYKLESSLIILGGGILVLIFFYGDFLKELLFNYRQQEPEIKDIKMVTEKIEDSNMDEKINYHTGLWLSWILTAIGLGLWIFGEFGEFSHSKFLSEIGFPIFLFGAAAVMTCSAFIFQNKDKAELNTRLDKIEREISLINNPPKE